MLQTLALQNFRSYDNGLFEFKPGVNIIVGANASGKTNLLEAIHYIAAMKGFRAHDRDLTSYDSDWFRLEAMTGDGVRVAKFRTEPAQKTMDIDGESKKRLTATHSLPIVVFEPDHMLLLGSEPSRRRSYIDGILSLTHPGYKSDMIAYKRALAQRNRLLKQESFSVEQLFVWDIQLSQKAGVIAAARYELVQHLNNICEATYQSIASNTDTLVISYDSTLRVESYAEDFLTYLRENVDKDRLRGFTGAGAHRDDIQIILKNTDARVSASRGETRSIILALKIAELELLHQKTGIKPLLLLDDVFSELDGSRRRALAEALQEYQTFLTTTDADVAVDHFSHYNIIPIS
jgi:DNA replication and repair protein RecF